MVSASPPPRFPPSRWRASAPRARAAPAGAKCHLIGPVRTSTAVMPPPPTNAVDDEKDAKKLDKAVEASQKPATEEVAAAAKMPVFE